MQHATLSVEKRTALGKKLKTLRNQGILPGNVYGKNIPSQSVQVDYKTFKAVYDEVGETGLVDLSVDGQVVPVLIKNVQIDYLRNPLHADFFQVNLKEKVKSMVPLEIIGEPLAVTEKVGILMPLLSEVEVEALPTDLPENITVNVEKLAAIDEQLTVADLQKPAGVEILTDPGQVVVKIAELVSKETLEEAAAAEAAAQAVKAEAVVEGAEGDVKAEGEPADAKDNADKEKPAEGEKESTKAAAESAKEKTK